jgi:glyoxylase-like metal-dependent hydrolase (beta-lactamase superfamily II)
MAWLRGCKTLHQISGGIVLIALPGRSRGHAAVAVDAGNNWVLHAGDAFYHPSTLSGGTRAPVAIRAFETVVALDLKRVRENHGRLADLYRRSEPDLFIVCAHDPIPLASAREKRST